MTNSSPKPSLLGRKRTKDLQETLHPEVESPISQVKKTLLDLQENLEAPVSPEPEKIKKIEPVQAKIEIKVEDKKVTKTSAEKISRVTFEQEAFEYLLQFHHNLKNPHQAVRVTYGVSEQNRRMLDAIKKVMNYYGESLKGSNLSQREITQKSQDLLDALVSRLVREGVKLRPLSLMPER